ncbi:hypothetical protein [Actinomadura sp. 3N407]|uniref:hypothetical protein n=1 Tax=Actinomadura sp. 3N407 TaxID=3457423 RepID=UPI003FCEC98B
MSGRRARAARKAQSGQVRQAGGAGEDRWSLAGSARWARRARIATAEHLRSAPIARSYQAAVLQHAFDVKVAHLGGYPAEAWALLLGGMGYRAPFPPDAHLAALMVLEDEARFLTGADLYVLTPQMCDVVVAAAQSLTEDDLELLDAEDLPSPSGLVVLPHPVLVQAVGGDLGDVRALHWRTPSQIQEPAPDGTLLQDRAAVRTALYNDTYGPVQPDTFAQLIAAARRMGAPLPPLMLDAIKCTPFRYHATGDQKQARQEYLALVQKAGEDFRRMHAAAGRDEEGVSGEYTVGSTITDGDDSFAVRFLYAFWRLCEQRIGTVAALASDQTARREAHRSATPDEVRVVHLRRADDRHPDQVSSGRDWRHRWVVRMHKVRQWYPSLQQHKVIYRGPYVKGPADKPLLGGETVRGLTR